MQLRCEDWRTAAADRIAPLYTVELERWRSRLDWDTTVLWSEAERGRAAGTLPGWVMIDHAGTIVGWTFYLLHRGTLQIGGLSAASEFIAERLLDAILHDEIAARAASVAVFAFSDAPGLWQALRRRGFTTDSYSYLARHLPVEASERAPRAGGPIALRPMERGDFSAGVDLLSRVYPLPDEARPFASRGAWAEWAEYLAQVTETDGCGTLLPDGCFSAVAGNRLVGLALTSLLTPHTAHLVQLAVDPDVRGAGLGHRLLIAACAAGSDAGCEQMTLLVSAANAPARRLYQRLGFEGTARFVAAGSFQPRRTMSAAADGIVIARL